MGLVLLVLGLVVLGLGVLVVLVVVLVLHWMMEASTESKAARPLAVSMAHVIITPALWRVRSLRWGWWCWDWCCWGWCWWCWWWWCWG